MLVKGTLDLLCTNKIKTKEWRKTHEHADQSHFKNMDHLWRKGNPSTLSVRMLIGTATMEYSMEIPPKPKNRTAIRSRSSTPGYISKERKTLT